MTGQADEYVAVVADETRAPLHERIELLAEVGIKETISVTEPYQALRRVRVLGRSKGLYVVDLNSKTAPILAWAISARRSVILDIGDDAYALARSSGVGLLSSAIRGLVDAHARLFAPRLVYRGRLHPVLRRVPQRSVWCPDTVPDWVLELNLSEGDPGTIATFGTMFGPDATGWTYGMEVVDTLRAHADLRGVVVGRGPGLAAFKAATREPALRGRLDVHDAMPIHDLVACLAGARFVTSYQSNDKAGWVRTTGKLPLVLGSGRVLLSSDVGEAALTLPREWRIPNDGRGGLPGAIGKRVKALADQSLQGAARALAEPYRRTRVARKLREFVFGQDDP